MDLFPDNIRSAWREKFAGRIKTLHRLFPNIKTEYVKRENGLFKTQFRVASEEDQEIVDAVSYKMERESARTCEECGKYGRRWEEHLPEKMCLCWQCHALVASTLAEIESSTESD